MALLPGPGRLPFLEERRHPLLCVAGHGVLGHRLRHPAVGVGLVEVDLLVEGVLADGQRERTGGSNLPRELERPCVELGRRDHLVDKAPIGGGGGVDRLPREQHVERPLAPDRAGHGHHRRRAEESDLDAGRREGGGLRGQREVAGRDQLTAGGGGDALDGRDDGLRDTLDGLHQLRAGGEDPLLVLERATDQLAEVVSGAESPAFSPQDEGSNLGARALLPQGAGDLGHQGHRQRVATLGAVERDHDGGQRVHRGQVFECHVHASVVRGVVPTPIRRGQPNRSALVGRARTRSSGGLFAGGRAAASWKRPRLPWHPAGVLERAAQEELDLRVAASKLVLRPPRDGVVDCRVEPQEDALAIGHRTLGVQGAGVDDGLRGLVAAQHREQVRHHRRPTLSVELHDAFLVQPLERHLHHADGAVDDAPARRDDRLRLLASEHGLGDLGRVREARQPRLDHVHPGGFDTSRDLGGEPCVDLLGVLAERWHVAPAHLVGEGGCDVPDRALGLDWRRT